MVEVGDRVTWPDGPPYGGIVWQISGNEAIVEVGWEDAYWVNVCRLIVLKKKEVSVSQDQVA